MIECDRLFGKEVVISAPIEGELIPLGQIMKIQLSATSDHEYYGPMIPKVFNHLRQAWKFQGWLQGYNGGPLRQPTQRIHDPQMFALRKGLLDAGLDPIRVFG